MWPFYIHRNSQQAEDRTTQQIPRSIYTGLLYSGLIVAAFFVGHCVKDRETSVPVRPQNTNTEQGQPAQNDNRSIPVRYGSGPEIVYVPGETPNIPQFSSDDFMHDMPIFVRPTVPDITNPTELGGAFLRSYAQNYSRELEARRAEERERARIRYRGGNPDRERLDCDAFGHVAGRRERRGYVPPSTAESYVVSEEVHAYPRGSITDRKSVALTPQDARRGREDLWRQGFSRRRQENYNRALQDVNRGADLARHRAGDFLRRLQQKK